jgi:DNA-binding NarL/FixJ family response regulator
MANEQETTVSFSRPITAYLNVNKITRAERRVIWAVLEGLSNPQCGDKLFVTEKTVKFHLTQIYKKLQTRDRTQLVIKLAKLGYYNRPKPADASLPTGVLN